LIELNDRCTFGVANEMKHLCYESAAGKRFSKDFLAQNNATHQKNSPIEEIAYKEAYMSDRSSSHIMSPVNQQLMVMRPSSYRTTTAGSHPDDGNYAPSEQSSSYATTPVNKQLVVMRPSSYRTTKAVAHPTDGHYAPSEQSLSYANTPVNQQLGNWQPQSCGRFSLSYISNAYYAPPHAHGQYVNYQQFKYSNSQPWMSFGSDHPNI
jgi:hypothetical protein